MTSVPDGTRVLLAHLCRTYGVETIRDTLFDLYPELGSVEYVPARKRDRLTSQHAADRHRTRDLGKFTAGSTKADLLTALNLRHLTAEEAATQVTGPRSARRETARKRVSDLATVGYIEDTGDRRPNVPGGPPATVWKLSASGLRAMHNLRLTGRTK